MAQITLGIRAILSHPLVYSTFQALMDAHSSRKSFVESNVRPVPGMKVLDIGCGPADILAYLPQVSYSGFDISKDYISQARKRFGPLGEFHCKHLSMEDLDSLPSYDIVFAMGLIHHLDDDEAIGVCNLPFARSSQAGVC